jgi:hypothetical protein
MDGLPGAGDTLTGGDIGRFSFGGEFRNTHVAIGVAPIYAPLFPQMSGGSTSQVRSRATISTGPDARVISDNNGQLFGFYFDASVGSALRLKLAAAGDFVIVNQI